MSEATGSPEQLQGWLRRRPWQVMLAGLGLLALGFGLALAGPGLVLLRLLAAAAGLLTAAAALRQHWRTAGWTTVEERLETAGLLATASFGALVALLTLEPAWDSGRWLLGVLTAVGLVGAGIVLLPEWARKTVLCLLALVHFGGILTAVLSLDMPAAPAPWVAAQLWTRFYRPYLQFAYLNNAYHFYSPEPGPPALLWFRVQYSNGKSRWVKVPARETSPVPLHYQRILALTESTNQITSNQHNDEKLSRLRERRERAGQILGVPLHPGIPTTFQYREPRPYSRLMLSTYARYIARKYPHVDDPEEDEIKSVKVYRVVHSIIPAPQMAAGLKPWDKQLYFPYYQGEFDAEGTLLDPGSPFLYWLLPILPDASQPGGYRDGLAIHAGDEWATEPESE